MECGTHMIRSGKKQDLVDRLRAQFVTWKSINNVARWKTAIEFPNLRDLLQRRAVEDCADQGVQNCLGCRAPHTAALGSSPIAGMPDFMYLNLSNVPYTCALLF
jgi:hypothetical protein